ncbi:hypothetical protein ACSBR1_030379 [Camellia fascicularis]
MRVNVNRPIIHSGRSLWRITLEDPYASLLAHLYANMRQRRRQTHQNFNKQEREVRRELRLPSLAMEVVVRHPSLLCMHPLLWTVLALIAVVRVPFYKHWSAELRFALPFVAALLFMLSALLFEALSVRFVTAVLGLDWHRACTCCRSSCCTASHFLHNALDLLTSFSIGRPTYEFPHPLAHLSYIVVDLLIRWGIRGYINDFRKRNLKLAPIADFSLYCGSISHLPTAYMWSRHVMPKPSDWGPQVDVVGYCFLNLGSKYQPPEEFVQWIQKRPQPIYIGFGSISKLAKFAKRWATHCDEDHGKSIEEYRTKRNNLLRLGGPWYT